MTTPVGNIAISDVDAELQIADPQFLGTSAFRALAGVSSGPISLGQLRGKTRPANQTPPPPPPSSGGGTPSNPFVPRGTFLYQGCQAWQMMNYYADGAGGTYSTVADPLSVACGYNPNPPRGQLLLAYCSGTDKYGNYTDGVGGAYSQLIEANSLDCGYNPNPPPTAGTILGTFCGTYTDPNTGEVGTPYTLFGTYANGTGGSYVAPIEHNSAQCGAPNFSGG